MRFKRFKEFHPFFIWQTWKEQGAHECACQSPTYKMVRQAEWSTAASSVQYFLLSFHKAKHACPMSSYSEDVPLLKRLGANVRVASFTWRGHTDHAEHCLHHQRGVTSKVAVCWIYGAAFWWVWGHNKNWAGNHLHCVCVQQQRVYLGLSWTDWTGCCPNRAGHNKQTCETFPGHRLGCLYWKLVAVCTDGAAVKVGVYNCILPKLWQLAAVGDSLVHILCTTHTLENCAKLTDRNVPYCETFNCYVVKLLQFYLQKGRAKKATALKRLCEEMGSPLWNWARFIISDGLHGGMTHC